MRRFYFIMIVFLGLMTDVAAQTQLVRIFSHRGGRLEFDENTMTAFKSSYDAGYRGFETDVRMSSDGELFLFHDNDLSRCTDAEGPLESMTSAQLRKVRTKAGNRLCTLDEFLSFLKNCGDEDLYVEFEIKTNTKLYSDETLEKLCDKLYSAVRTNQPKGAEYLFTSIDYRSLRYIQQKYKTDDLMLVTVKPCNDETIALCKAMGISRLGAKMPGTSREDVKKAHEAGLIVSLWPGLTVDDLVLGVWLGADFLCTDRPVEYMEFVRSKLPWLNVKY